MRSIFLALALSLGTLAHAQDANDVAIQKRVEKLRDLVFGSGAHFSLETQEKQDLLTNLNRSIRILEGQGPTGPQGSALLCIKGSNALFYPARRSDFNIIGSSEYQAGHANLAACQATLPEGHAQMACFKQSTASTTR